MLRDIISHTSPIILYSLKEILIVGPELLPVCIFHKPPE